MTEAEFKQTGCDNHHCKIEFKDGTTASGVITTYHVNEPHKWGLVESLNMLEYDRLQKENDKEGMEKLCRPVNLADIVSARRV